MYIQRKKSKISRHSLKNLIFLKIEIYLKYKIKIHKLIQVKNYRNTNNLKSHMMMGVCGSLSHLLRKIKVINLYISIIIILILI